MTGLRHPGLIACALWLAIALAVAVGGGLGEGVQIAFVILVGVVSMLAAADLAGPVRLAPPVVVLLLLGLWASASALWAIVDPAAAIRSGMVLFALASVVVISGRLAVNQPLRFIAVPVAVIAVACGIVGLYGAAVGEVPLAYRIEGVWRPAGPFEYPPALAMLQVSALPLLVRFAAGAENGWARLGGAIGLAIAATVLALAESRLALALAAITVGVCLLGPTAAYVAPRRLRVAALVPAAVAAVSGSLLAGGLADGREGRGLGLLSLLLAAVVVAGVVSVLVRDRLARTGPSSSDRDLRPLRSQLAALIVVVALAGVAFSVTTERTGGGIEDYAGPLHGREAQWSAALDAIAERPLRGSGAGTFYVATAADQGKSPSLYAHSWPLEAGAELGILGMVLVLALYMSIARELWRARRAPALWLIGPGVIGFLLFGLVDWQWHLTGAAALWGMLLGWELTASRGSATVAPFPTPSGLKGRSD